MIIKIGLLLSFILIILKLSNQLNWGWLAIFSPTILGIVITIIGVAYIAILLYR